MKINFYKYNYFFFDFDGVIVDSLGIKTQAFGELFKDHGRDIVKKVMAYHVANGGVSRYEKFRYYYNDLLKKEITPEIIADLDKRFSALVVEKVISADIIKGAAIFLKKLAGEKKTCFIISATPRGEIQHIVRSKKLDAFFKEVAGSPPEKTENLKSLLDKYAVNPREAVYFGDAKSDYDAAKVNGVKFIGVVTGKGGELVAMRDIPKIKDFVKERGQNAK